MNPSAFAQQQSDTKPSLLEKISLAKDDSTKVLLLLELSSIEAIPDSAIHYSIKALAIGEKINSPLLMTECHKQLGGIYRGQSTYQKALLHYKKAFTLINSRESVDQKELAALHRLLSTVYFDRGDLLMMIDHNFEALKIYRTLNDEKGIATSYSSIGLGFATLGDYEKAFKYQKEAIGLYEKYDLKHGLAYTKLNMAESYTRIGKYEEALEWGERSLQIFRAMEDEMGIAYNFENYALTYKGLQQYDKALHYAVESQKIYDKLGYKRGSGYSLKIMGTVYLALAEEASKIKMEQKLLISADSCLKEAVDVLSGEAKDFKNLSEIYEALSRVAQLANNYKTAFEWQHKYIHLRDSLYSHTQGMDVAEIEHLHDIELKDREVQLSEVTIAKKKIEQYYLIAGLCLLLFSTSLFFRNYRKQKILNRLLDSEKETSEELLHNILPTQVAKELKENGFAEAQQFSNATVIFTDFKDFTNYAGHFSPYELVKTLNEYFSEFDRIIESYGIEKIKTIGDSYMAAGGLLDAGKTNARHVVKAALEMTDFIEKQKVLRGDKAFEMRTGIHTGPVVAGIVGVKKFQYDIWGDTVNIASRMETHGEVGKVNISQSTYELIKDDPQFQFEPRGKVAAKGKGEVEMYFVN